MERLKITMKNRRTKETGAALCVLLFAALPVSASDIYTGGIALEKTAKLAQESVPLPDGNPQPVLALAMRHGQAKGHFSGKAAEAVRQQYGRDIPISVTAERKEAVSGKPGCRKIRLTYKSGGAFAGRYPDKSIDVEVCPNKSGR